MNTILFIIAIFKNINRKKVNGNSASMTRNIDVFALNSTFR